MLATPVDKSSSVSQVWNKVKVPEELSTFKAFYKY